MPKDYYDILGVAKEASQEEIKRAYRQKAMRLHPDVNPSQEALFMFQELSEAYEVLSNPTLRADYDSDDIMIRIPDEEPGYETSPRRAWNMSSRYDPDDRPFVDTDYAYYSRSTTIIGVITFLFAFSFLIDYLFYQTFSNETIEEISLKASQTNNPKDTDYLRVKTTHITLDIRRGLDELLKGDQLDIRRSLLYGNTSFRRAGAGKYIRVDGISTLLYIVAIICYLFSLAAMLNKQHPERKFNAAIISGFLSMVLIVLILLG